MAAISCHEEAFLSSEAPSGIHQGDILPGMRPFVWLECASKVFHLKGAPSSVRNEPRKRFVQECGSSPVRECASKMLRPGPFGCAGERKVVIAVFCPRRSTASVPWGSGRCGAAEFRVLDVAVDAMAAERVEHERVQVQVQVRARMPLLPPALQGFGGRRHRGVSSLRALAAAMRIARKRNRSPQNGAGRDDGSSQCSLL